MGIIPTLGQNLNRKVSDKIHARVLDSFHLLFESHVLISFRLITNNVLQCMIASTLVRMNSANWSLREDPRAPALPQLHPLYGEIITPL